MIDDFEEVWVELDDFPMYLVSNHGQVKHVDRNQPRRISANHMGFPVVTLFRSNDPSRYLRQVNKLVADSFLPSPLHEDETALWHIDGNLLNCYASNLRWDTRSRVLEWNRMIRAGEPRLKTPRVMNNRTGQIYDNAYECAIAESKLESTIVWMIDGNHDMFDANANYRYVKDW